VGQKAPFKLKEIWAIRIRLQIAHRCRDLALFNLAVDSKLRACDLMNLRVRDVCHGPIMASRALILQQKTSRPVQFEITEPARIAVAGPGLPIRNEGLKTFSSRVVFTPPRISQPASMLGLWIPGSCSWDWIPPTMARIRSAEPKRR
jgi:hypothetical protein